MAHEYELIVIGGGAAGSTAAKKAARRGRRVALVEMDKLGGACLNHGCDPTKAMLHTARVLHQARHAASLGLDIDARGVDWPRLRRRVQGIIEEIRGGSHEDAVARQRDRGIDVYLGRARFTGPREVAVGDDTLRAERVIIAAGNRPSVPPVDGLREAGFLTSRDAVALDALPRRLAVIGAGPVGMEFAQLFARFGVQVAVLEMAAHVLPHDDPELAGLLQGCMEKEGIRFELGAKTTRASAGAKGKSVEWERDGERGSLEADEILVGAGRVPNTDGLDLEKAGIATRGNAVEVDAFLRSSADGVYAAGDVTGTLPFTHVASPQGALAAENAFAEAPERFSLHGVPWATYTDPPLAHVGDGETELEEAGAEFEVVSLELADVPRYHVTGEREGMAKLFVAPESGRILGAQILGADADELIGVAAMAMRHGLTARQLGDTVFPYPTRSQALRILARRL